MCYIKGSPFFLNIFKTYFDQIRKLHDDLNSQFHFTRILFFKYATENSFMLTCSIYVSNVLIKSFSIRTIVPRLSPGYGFK